MCGLVFRGVGMVRAKACIAMTNLVYNMCRLVQIKRYHAEWIVESQFLICIYFINNQPYKPSSCKDIKK